MAYYLNAVFTFVFFMLGRLVYQLYITFWVGAPKVESELADSRVGYFQGFVILEMFTMVSLSILLNFYWMYLMVKMIVRVLSRGTQTPVPDKTEKVELVQAD